MKEYRFAVRPTAAELAQQKSGVRMARRLRCEFDCKLSGRNRPQRQGDYYRNFSFERYDDGAPSKFKRIAIGPRAMPYCDIPGGEWTSRMQAAEEKRLSEYRKNPTGVRIFWCDVVNAERSRGSVA